jgi:hypothetical protein
MLDQQILDEALTKKNREYENLKNQHLEMRKNYEAKTKNLMNSINLLKSEKTMIETTTKDNIRVNIINKLKEERADQELIICLLRKQIGDEDKIDKYLTKEFYKKGAQRAPTFEELKIKIKQLEAEIVSLKFKNLTSKKTNTNNIGESCDTDNHNFNSELKLKSAYSNKNYKSGKIDFAKIECDEIIEIKMAEKFKFEIIKYEEKIQNIEKENTLLKIAKAKMEKSQNELFEKLENYNEEIGELKSIYDTIKKNLEDECNTKVIDAMQIISEKDSENKKLKEKINEMIEICEKQNKENLESIKRLNSENELLRRVLEAKKYEISVLASEIKNYQSQIDKNSLVSDNTKDYMRIRNIEKEKDVLKKTNAINEEKIKHLDSLIKQKEFLLESLHNSIDDKENILREKEEEIDLLICKMQEMELIMMKNYVKNQYKNF